MKNKSNNDSPIIHEGNLFADPLSILNVFNIFPNSCSESAIQNKGF